MLLLKLMYGCHACESDREIPRRVYKHALGDGLMRYVKSFFCWADC